MREICDDAIDGALFVWAVVLGWCVPNGWGMIIFQGNLVGLFLIAGAMGLGLVFHYMNVKLNED